MHERALGDMKLQSRCPHCHQIEPMGVDIDTQASHECPSCGLRYVPLRHLFVADDLTQVSIAVRDDPVPPPPKGRAVPEPMSAEELAASLAKVAALAQQRQRRWRFAALTLAVVLGGGTLAATALLLRRRPEDVGQTVDGEPPTSAGQAGPQRGALQVVDAAWAGRNWTAKSALRTLKFWCFFTANLTVWGIANSMLTQHHAAYAQDAGHSSATIAAMVGLYGITNVIGNLCEIGRAHV